MRSSKSDEKIILVREYAELLLSHARLARSKLSNRQLTRLLDYQERLVSADGESLFALVKEIALFIHETYKKSFKQEWMDKVVRWLPSVKDKVEQLKEKLSTVKPYLHSANTSAHRQKRIVPQSILVIGAEQAGVTSLITQFVDRKFSLQHRSTMSTDYKTWNSTLDENEIVLNIWDVDAHFNFQSQHNARFLSAVDAVIVAADLTREESLRSVQSILDMIKYLIPNNPIKIIAGTKCDSDWRNVSHEDIRSCADSNGCQYIETSAKENKNVIELFSGLAEQLTHRSELTAEEERKIHNEEPIDITILQNIRTLLNNKIWNTLTSTFAKQPRGFQELVTCINSNIHVKDKTKGNMLEEIKAIAAKHTSEVVEPRFFLFSRKLRHPKLRLIYQAISCADTIDDILSYLNMASSELISIQKIASRFGCVI